MKTRKKLEEYLNEICVPGNDRKSQGGRIPDNCKYGTWLRKNDPMQFNIAFREF